MDQQQQSRWRPTRIQVFWSLAIVAVLTVAVLIGYRYGITLWDWLKLLVVPAVIAGGGLWFNRQQRQRELEIARQQREQELDIAEWRTQDEALQVYLDQMSDMLIPKEGQPSLFDESPPESLDLVARARSLTVLPRLDGERKARVVQFLNEAGLIAKKRPVLDLQGADLSDAQGITNEELDRQADSLKGATMPNGQKYEDWLKSKDRKEGEGERRFGAPPSVEFRAGVALRHKGETDRRSEPSRPESSDPMREAGAPNTKEVVATLGKELCPPHRGWA